jgi:hypothetical protein
MLFTTRRCRDVDPNIREAAQVGFPEPWPRQARSAAKTSSPLPESMARRLAPEAAFPSLQVLEAVKAYATALARFNVSRVGEQ